MGEALLCSMGYLLHTRVDRTPFGNTWIRIFYLLSIKIFKYWTFYIFVYNFLSFFLFISFSLVGEFE